MDQENANAIKIDDLERRIVILEKHRETDKQEIHELDKTLGMFTTEMKNITNELKTIVNNFKEAMIRSTDAQHKEVLSLKEKVIENDEKIKNLSEKIEKETTGANAEKWKNVSKYVLTALIGGVIAFVLSKLGLQ